MPRTPLTTLEPRCESARAHAPNEYMIMFCRLMGTSKPLMTFWFQTPVVAVTANPSGRCTVTT